jgi:Leu/Phe-tRNA-protein transferase
LDCQVYSEHLEKIGAKEVLRDEFLDMLRMAL